MNSDRGVYDPLADSSAANYSRDGEVLRQQRIYLEAFKPSELRAYQVPEDHILVGSNHIQKGATTVVAGPPDVGKSRAAIWLAEVGAIGEGASWFGLPVHFQFRTLLLQNENGLARLHDDFTRIKLPDDVIDQWIRVTSPPPFGMLMDHCDFRAQLRALIMEFKPHLLVIDPWNSVTRDVMERDYHQAFVYIREVLADCPENPACLIIHHLRKPRL
jgi:RecA-family ATPase